MVKKQITISSSISTKDIITYSLLVLAIGLAIIAIVFQFISSQPSQSSSSICIGNTCLNEKELQNIKNGIFTELKTEFLDVDRSGVSGNAGGQCISLKGSPSEVPYISYYSNNNTLNGNLQVAPNGELWGIKNIGIADVDGINRIINQKNIANVAPDVINGTLKNYSQCITTGENKIAELQLKDDSSKNATRGGMCGLFYKNPSWILNDTSDDRKDIYKN